MDYVALKSQMTASLDALRRQVADGVDVPTAALAELCFEQLEELEATGAPLEDRVRTIRQVLSAASGLQLPLDFEAVTA